MRLLWSIFILAISAQAQLQLYIAPQNAAEQPVSGLYDVGRSHVGDSAATRFRIRNTGTATVTLSVLNVSGTGFSMTGQPSLPHLVAPGTNVDFTINFRPNDYGSFSANLQVNAVGYLLRGSGMAAATFYLDGKPVSSGGTINFGRVERGSEQVLRLEARNTTREPIAVNSLAISDSGFTFATGNPAPFALEAGQTTTFAITFAPLANRIFTATLTIDGLRTIKLTGTGLEPPMPRPVISIDTPTARSGEQGRVSVRLANISRAAGKGQIRMELLPSANAKDNDAAAQFLSGGRTVSFNVTEGSSDVAFDKTGETTLTFQTGTTAGSLVFTVEAGGYTERATLVLAPEPVRVDKAAAIRTTSSIDVQLSGFDNSRTIGDLLFTFYGTSGQPLTATPIRVSAASDFGRWWESSTLGGIFSLRASFPITGDASQIKSVEVQMVNSVGTSRTDRLTF